MAVRHQKSWPFASKVRGRSPIYFWPFASKVRGRSPPKFVAVRYQSSWPFAIKVRGRSFGPVSSHILRLFNIKEFENLSFIVHWGCKNRSQFVSIRIFVGIFFSFRSPTQNAFLLDLKPIDDYRYRQRECKNSAYRTCNSQDLKILILKISTKKNTYTCP